MAIEYTWTISQLDCHSEAENQMNVVFMAYWSVKATDGKFVVVRRGAVPIAYDSDAPFISYEELTQNQIIDWVKVVLEEQELANIKKDLAENIANLSKPSGMATPLPWATTSVDELP